MDFGILAIMIVVGAVGLAAIALTIWALRRSTEMGRHAAVLSAKTETLLATQQQLAGQLSHLTTVSTSQQADVGRTLNERLEQLTRRLDQRLEHSSEKTTKSLGELQTRLAMIDAAQKNIAELSTQVVSLQDILANKQARGAFGEIQLSDIVQNALPPSAYAFQQTLGNGTRCDCLIRMPNPPGPIVVDAKFPLESYRRLHDAKDQATRTAAASDFRRDIQGHVRDISEKYIVPGETADSALMFLPSEAVYAELHANFLPVVEQSYRARVWIVSPTTLMATLNTVRAVLKDARMREQAGVIQAQVHLLTDDIKRLDQRVTNLRSHFDRTDKDIRDIQISTDKILRHADKIEEIQLQDAHDDEPAVAEPSLKIAEAGD